MNISIEPLLKFRLDRFPRATVLCDLDGTLVETDFANCLSYRQAIIEVTNGVSTLEIRPGRRFVRTDLQVDFPELNDDQCRRIVALKEQYFESFLGLEFTVKVSNQTAARQEGRVRLSFNDAQNEQSADKLLDNTQPEIDFDIPAKESRSYSWRIKVPDGAPFLTYKAVASTGKVSDGEEGYLPVLSRRIFVTESLPLPIRGKAGGAVTKKFEFEKLLKSGKSGSLVHQNYVVQMFSNPSWYAVMALPYLMEYPHECSEQTFNRLYANGLARHVANSDPRIRRVFDLWKGTPALQSPLEKNADLKSVLLEVTYPSILEAIVKSGVAGDVAALDRQNSSGLEKQLFLSII